MVNSVLKLPPHIFCHFARIMNAPHDIMHVLRLGFFGWVNVMEYNHIACNDTSKCAAYDLN